VEEKMSTQLPSLPSQSSFDEKLRRGFKNYLNPFMLLLWRLGLGSWVNWWPQVGGRIMVLTHTGRKSGQRRRTPVNYTIIEGDIYCTAGFGKLADWYRNMLRNPNVEVWLPDGWWAGDAIDVSDDPNRMAILRQVLFASGFAAYAAGLDPVKMSDEALDAATKEYRLVRIRRRIACTGTNGPGDLSWVWPLATFILLPLALFRRGRRR